MSFDQPQLQTVMALAEGLGVYVLAIALGYYIERLRHRASDEKFNVVRLLMLLWAAVVPAIAPLGYLWVQMDRGPVMGVAMGRLVMWGAALMIGVHLLRVLLMRFNAEIEIPYRMGYMFFVGAGVLFLASMVQFGFLLSSETADRTWYYDALIGVGMALVGVGLGVWALREIELRGTRSSDG